MGQWRFTSKSINKYLLYKKIKKTSKTDKISKKIYN